MSIKEIQKMVINKLKTIDNEITLNKVNTILDSDIKNKINFTEQQKLEIIDAQIQIKNGEFITLEESNNKLEGWLKK